MTTKLPELPEVTKFGDEDWGYIYAYTADQMLAIRDAGIEYGKALAQQPSAEAVAWRYFKQLTSTRFAWSRWLGMDECHHYGPDGNLVDGPPPECKVEYAYLHPPAAREVTEEMVKVAETTRVKILRGLTAYGSDTIEELREIAMRVALTAAMNQETAP